MSNQNTTTMREQQLSQIVESGLYGVLPIENATTPGTYCFFALDEPTDLVVQVEDFFGGETRFGVNLDQVVDDLLDTITEEPPKTWDGKMEDILTLRNLALRFHKLATRLAGAARQQEQGLGLREKLIG
jgi:hypothetical protein